MQTEMRVAHADIQNARQEIALCHWALTSPLPLAPTTPTGHEHILGADKPVNPGSQGFEMLGCGEDSCGSLQPDQVVPGAEADGGACPISSELVGLLLSFGPPT